ncbi:hypothetical protein BGX27_010919 [Mortierella sp. AM989]|nr:hypothetical protein BGX27_010919 [Mortierella sp. AM989]
MKFILKIAALALAASQAMAVIPTPIKSCTKVVTVPPFTDSCVSFANNYGCKFFELLEWNLNLSPTCNNLDPGIRICVSVTPQPSAGVVPIKGCTKTVTVRKRVTSCSPLASANKCSVKNLLRWNRNLKSNCKNLKIGNRICVSVTPKNGH